MIQHAFCEFLHKSMGQGIKREPSLRILTIEIKSFVKPAPPHDWRDKGRFLSTSEWWELRYGS